MAGNKSIAHCFPLNTTYYNYSNNSTVASAYFSAVFSVLGLSSNLFALIVLVKTFRHTRSRSRSSFLLFLCGLVVTDFMGLLVTGSIVVSFRMTHFSWMSVDPKCHFCNFMGMSMVFYGLCPLLLGATMAVERFVGINWPFARSANVPKSRACYVVAGVWVTAGLISLLPILGLGSYHLQPPGSWCFLNISSRFPVDMAFCLIFSLVGLLSLFVSFVLNTVSVVTLLRVFCGQDSTQRRRDYEVEMMVQLILIMVIASICWCPLLEQARLRKCAMFCKARGVTVLGADKASVEEPSPVEDNTGSPSLQLHRHVYYTNCAFGRRTQCPQAIALDSICHVEPDPGPLGLYPLPPIRAEACVPAHGLVPGLHCQPLPLFLQLYA
ncbi:hypothetical protein MHYP_G00229790 [Metynnis hypsauchen]